MRSALILAAVALVIGVLTQPNTWLQASKIGVPYPGVLVAFLDTPSVGASLAFVGGALAHRRWQAAVSGPSVILVSFVGYYGAYGWDNGASGAPSWTLVALLSGPIAGTLGWLWRARYPWLVAAPIGFVGSDALALAIDRSPHLDGSQYADVAFSAVVVGVAMAVLTHGGLSARLRFLGIVAASVVTIFLAIALIVDPLLGLLDGNWSWPRFPDRDGDGRPN